MVDLKVHGLLRGCVAGDDVRELGGVPVEDAAAEVPEGPRGEVVAGDLPVLPPLVAVRREDAVSEEIARLVVVRRALSLCLFRNIDHTHIL